MSEKIADFLKSVSISSLSVRQSLLDKLSSLGIVNAYDYLIADLSVHTRFLPISSQRRLNDIIEGLCKESFSLSLSDIDFVHVSHLGIFGTTKKVLVRNGVIDAGQLKAMPYGELSSLGKVGASSIDAITKMRISNADISTCPELFLSDQDLLLYSQLLEMPIDKLGLRKNIEHILSENEISTIVDLLGTPVDVISGLNAIDYEVLFEIQDKVNTNLSSRFDDIVRLSQWLSVKKCGFSKLCMSSLLLERLYTIGQLVAIDPKSLSRLPNIGPRARATLYSFLDNWFDQYKRGPFYPGNASLISNLVCSQAQSVEDQLPEISAS